jgi:hypothetical protein
VARPRIGEPVPHSFSHAPFRRRQEVVVTGPTAGLFWWHEAHVIRPDTYLPYPLPRGLHFALSRMNITVRSKIMSNVGFGLNEL